MAAAITTTTAGATTRAARERRRGELETAPPGRAERGPDGPGRPLLGRLGAAGARELALSADLGGATAGRAGAGAAADRAGADGLAADGGLLTAAVLTAVAWSRAAGAGRVVVSLPVTWARPSGLRSSLLATPPPTAEAACRHRVREACRTATQLPSIRRQLAARRVPGGAGPVRRPSQCRQALSVVEEPVRQPTVPQRTCLNRRCVSRRCVDHRCGVGAARRRLSAWARGSGGLMPLRALGAVSSGAASFASAARAIGPRRA